MRLPIATKIGAGRGKQLSAELLVNMYAEDAPDNAISQVTAIGCPGFTEFSDINADLIRGVHKTLADGAVYAVIGNALFTIDNEGTETSLGTIAGSGRVSMADNGVEICIVAGAISYTYNSTEGLEKITSPDFPGAESVTEMDGYFIFNNPNAGQRGQFFISDLLDGEVYDAADFATAERYPDNLVRVFSDHSELLLFGTDSIEIWFNAGNADFPFSRAQGSVIEQGLGAKWTVEKVDESVIWLDNEGMVRRLQGNTPVRISTHVIEHLISLGDWTNAYTYSYAQEGHQFYVLTIPAANLNQTAGTYVWDAATGRWHQRKSYELAISRVGFYLNAFGKHIVGDVFTGKFYDSSLDVNHENGDPIVAEIQFPTLHMDGQPFIVHSFQLDMDVGHIVEAVEVSEPGTPPGSYNFFDDTYWIDAYGGAFAFLGPWISQFNGVVPYILEVIQSGLNDDWEIDFRPDTAQITYGAEVPGTVGCVVYDTAGNKIGGESFAYTSPFEQYTFDFPLTFISNDIAGINIGYNLGISEPSYPVATDDNDSGNAILDIVFVKT